MTPVDHALALLRRRHPDLRFGEPQDDGNGYVFVESAGGEVVSRISSGGWAWDYDRRAGRRGEPRRYRADGCEYAT